MKAERNASEEDTVKLSWLSSSAPVSPEYNSDISVTCTAQAKESRSEILDVVGLEGSRWISFSTWCRYASGTDKPLDPSLFLSSSRVENDVFMRTPYLRESLLLSCPYKIRLDAMLERILA